MTKIKVMDEVLANKIAAGEVVEKTMNVVKELVENSIDAGASEIRVELKDSGIKEIKVSDDGVGMNREDATTAFLRHATSKLSRMDDLFHISSLGFRGEALPSIASVSKVELHTSDGEEGTVLHINGGKIQDINAGDLRKGTIITVSDLFYNTPVRLKYLKNPYAELANIVEYVNKMALSYPNIKFYLTNNDKELLNTDGSGNLLKVIGAVYGLEVAKNMIEINIEDDDYLITGYIGYPILARTARSVITTFVNGRFIRNYDLNRAICEGYHTFIPHEKYPIVVLNIDVDPILVDINIHPTKMDIKFSKMEELKNLIQNMIHDALIDKNLVPKIHDIVDIPQIERPTFESIKKEESNNEETEYQSPEEITLNFEINDSEERVKSMHPVGVVHATYIIAENEDGMYIIDQHAANERINYEKCLATLVENNAKNVLHLLVPVTLEFSKNDFLILREHLDLLRDIHIGTEEFGDNTLIIRTHPTFLPKGREKDGIRKICEIIISREAFDMASFIDHVAATMACKMSIKANDYISKEEQQALLDTLCACKNPFTCPHGRPTVISYTNYDLERLFKRVMN